MSDYYLIDGIEYEWPIPETKPESEDDQGRVVEDVDSGLWFTW